MGGSDLEVRRVIDGQADVLGSWRLNDGDTVHLSEEDDRHPGPAGVVDTVHRTTVLTWYGPDDPDSPANAKRKKATKSKVTKRKATKTPARKRTTTRPKATAAKKSTRKTAAKKK
jgi:hypothetical protein